jgi:serine phosphatase RsbU (regulator of sigma subunit)
MSVARRRAASALAAILLLAVAFTYTGWRLHRIGQEGWAGLSYYPQTSKSKKETTHLPSFMMRPGTIMMIYPDGPAERAGLRRGDRIVAIGGIALTDFDGVTALGKRVRYGQTIPYRVELNGSQHDVPVRFGSPTDSAVFLGLFGVTCFVAFVYLSIGLFVFWLKPRDARGVIFFAMTLCAAATFVSVSILPVEGMNSRGFAMVQPAFADLARPLALAGAGVFFAPLLLHLALIFPRPRPVLARGRPLWQWIYGYPLYVLGLGVLFAGFVSKAALLDATHGGASMKLLARFCGAVFVIAGIAALARVILAMRRLGAKEGVYQRPLATMTLAFLLLLGLTGGIGFLAGKTQAPFVIGVAAVILVFCLIASFAAYPLATFISLLRSYREAGVEERRQLKWPLWGTMIAVGGRVLLYALGLGVGLVITFRSDFTVSNILMTGPDILAKLLYLLIPLSFAFAILKYRLMNIDVIIRKTVLYTMLSAIVLVLYIGLVAGVGSLVIHFTAVKSQTMVIGATILVGLIAIPMRNKLQRMVDRNLFREQRNFALALRNISSAIAGGDLHVFLQKAAEEVQQAVQNRFVLIALRSETHYGAAAKVGIADEILQTLQIPFADYPEEAPESAPALRRLGTKLVMPIREHGGTLGFLALGSKLSDQDFAPDDVQFLAAAAQQLALGIENVRLRSEETDFAQARAMQQILLPTQFPKVDGFGISAMWQPARSVGGDYYDTIALGEGKVAVCIADVAGKGMPAALMMANLQAAVKAIAAPGLDPAQLCEKVKNVVSGNLAGGTFITFFYGVLDAVRKTFTYSNAGHNAPVVVRADGSVERLTVGGSALCRLFRNDAHSSATIDLRPGDRLVLFTDGASEARRGEEEFGEERVVATVVANRHLAAQPLQSVIAGAIAAFSGGNLDDDLTLVVVAAE